MMIRPITVLNTRPAPQNSALSAQLAAIPGVSVIELPMLEICEMPKKLIETAVNKVLSQGMPDYLIFTSVFSVMYGQAFFNQKAMSSQVFAIGEQTGKVLKRAGWDNVNIPQEMNSEGLLASNALQAIENKYIVIVKGKDGLGLLPETLSHRGAKVFEFCCYQRQIPCYAPAEIAALFKQSRIDIILMTSVSSYHHFKQLIPAECLNYIQSSQWLAFSDRIKTVIQADWPDALIAVCLPQTVFVIEKVKQQLLRDNNDE